MGKTDVSFRPWALTDKPSLVKYANNKKISDNMRDMFPHPYCWENKKTKEIRNEIKDGEWFIQNKESAEPDGEDKECGRINHFNAFSFNEDFPLGEWMTTGFELGVTMKQLKAVPDAQFGLNISFNTGNSTQHDELHFVISNRSEYEVSITYNTKKLPRETIYLKKAEKSNAIHPNGVNFIKVKQTGADWVFSINDSTVYRHTFKPKADVTYVLLMIQDKASFQILSRYLDNKPVFENAPQTISAKTESANAQNNIRREYDRWGYKTESPIVDGKRNGIAKKYYKSGKINTETPFTNDTINGTEMYYYENGRVKVTTPFVKGKENGTKRFYFENGKLSQETPYVNGNEIGVQKAYFEGGKLHKETPHGEKGINGTTKSYYESGQLEYEAYTVNNVSNGINKYYYENGKLKTEYSYQNGTLLSTKHYDENGILKR